MHKRLLTTGLLLWALGTPLSTVLADNYVIYPIPQSMSMGSGTLALTPQMKVICESGVDQATRHRLEALLAQHGITVATEDDDTPCTVIRLGLVASGEAVERHALDVLGLNTAGIMVAGKFDRHAISVTREGITILGEHTNAVFCGLASLEQMLEQAHDGSMDHATIYDHADQQNRGLVEGYYGYPYSVEVKKDLMRYMMRYKMNTYMYGAKSDPYHSQMWKDAYPTSISAEQERNGWLTQGMIRDIARVSEETKVNFIWAIHPGNEFLGSATAIEDIMSKYRKMYALGVRHFGVFVDDVGIPSTDADMQKNAERLSQLQTAIESRWNTPGAAPADTVRPLHFVPQIYCNSFASSAEQRQRFMAALGTVQPYITVYSTGQGVWSVPNNSHTTTIMNEFGRPMGWWWNYPCNDNADGQLYPMDMYSNFVDMPAVGNGERLPSALNNCQGIVANPMQQGQVAKTSLFSIADYAWNNTAFDNTKSWEASFPGLISDEEICRAYHDITYYLRWNEPQTMQTLINAYKASLEAGRPDATALKATVQKVREDCRLVMKLRDSDIQSDRLLYNDIAPWLQTLHTYALITEKMLDLPGTPADQRKSQWLTVKEVCDSLQALESSALYTAYALEGMGNGISVSRRQAQLSRQYWFPFLSYLKAKAIDTYFHDADAISIPTAITNSPLIKAKAVSQDGTLALTMEPGDLDVNNYVGIALPSPTQIEGISMAERLLPLARYSTNGKEWKTISSATELNGLHIAYLIFINEGDKGIRDFALNDGDVSISLPMQAHPAKVSIPSGDIYQDHTADKLTDGDYSTYTCLNRNQASGDYYVLDLGKMTTLHDVRLCMGTTNGDHPTECRIETAGTSGNLWRTIDIKGTTTAVWNINLEQNVRYSNEMVYCDFDGAGRRVRYIRLNLTTPNTGKWLRLYEIEVNRQYAENSAEPACSDGNGERIKELTDGSAVTGLKAGAASPLTYSLNRINDIRAVTFYSQSNGVQPVISVTTDGTDWQTVGTLTQPCQTVDLQSCPKALAVRLEWQGEQAPAIYEIGAEHDLSSSSLPTWNSDLAKAFALLKAEALQALDSCGQQKLITGNSQFSSPYTEPTEGSINNLLDGNQATFWHSRWSGSAVADGVHYLEIALPEGTEGEVTMHYGRRSNSNTHQLTQARIQGVVSGSGTSAETEDIVDLDLPYTNQSETLIRRFTLPKAYPAIRLLELKTSGTDGSNSAGFFHIGEMQLYSSVKHYILRNAQAEAEALLAATAPMPSEATETDLQTLKDAYAAFMHKVFDVPVEIISLPADGSLTGNDSIYDLTGRRIASPVRGGVYIMGGRKVIIK